MKYGIMQYQLEKNFMKIFNERIGNWGKNKCSDMFCSEIDLKNIVFRSVGSLHLGFIAWLFSILFHFSSCPVDDTFRLHQTDSDTAIRFSITSFLFLRSNSRQFFMHCDLKICDKTDESCLTGCNDAKKIFKSLYTRRTRNKPEARGKLFFLILHGFYR